MTRGTTIILGMTLIGTIRIGMTRGMDGAIIRFLGIARGIITVGITDLITGIAVITGDIGTDITTDTGTAIGILTIGMTGDTAIMAPTVTEIQ